MTRRGEAPRLPQPPWSYAPSEVAEWLGSTAGRRRPRKVRRKRPATFRRFVARYPSSVESRIIRNLARLKFLPARGGGVGSRRQPPGPLPAARTLTYRRAFGDAEVEVRLRDGESVEIRVRFKPPVSLPRGLKLVSRLGLRPSQGRWR